MLAVLPMKISIELPSPLELSFRLLSTTFNLMFLVPAADSKKDKSEQNDTIFLKSVLTYFIINSD